MKPTELLERLRICSQQFKLTDPVLHLPITHGQAYRNLDHNQITAQDLRDFVEWVEALDNCAHPKMIHENQSR